MELNNPQLEQKIRELKAIIKEQREWDNQKVADLFAEELQTLLANEALVGNNPKKRLEA